MHESQTLKRLQQQFDEDITALTTSANAYSAKSAFLTRLEYCNDDTEQKTFLRAASTQLKSNTLDPLEIFEVCRLWSCYLTEIFSTIGNENKSLLAEGLRLKCTLRQDKTHIQNFLNIIAPDINLNEVSLEKCNLTLEEGILKVVSNVGATLYEIPVSTPPFAQYFEEKCLNTVWKCSDQESHKRTLLTPEHLQLRTQLLLGKPAEMDAAAVQFIVQDQHGLLNNTLQMISAWQHSQDCSNEDTDYIALVKAYVYQVQADPDEFIVNHALAKDKTHTERCTELQWFFEQLEPGSIPACLGVLKNYSPFDYYYFLSKNTAFIPQDQRALDPQGLVDIVLTPALSAFDNPPPPCTPDEAITAFNTIMETLSEDILDQTYSTLWDRCHDRHYTAPIDNLLDHVPRVLEKTSDDYQRIVLNALLKKIVAKNEYHDEYQQLWGLLSQHHPSMFQHLLSAIQNLNTQPEKDNHDTYAACLLSQNEEAERTLATMPQCHHLSILGHYFNNHFQLKKGIMDQKDRCLLRSLDDQTLQALSTELNRDLDDDNETIRLLLETIKEFIQHRKRALICTWSVRLMFCALFSSSWLTAHSVWGSIEPIQVWGIHLSLESCVTLLSIIAMGLMLLMIQDAINKTLCKAYDLDGNNLAARIIQAIGSIITTLALPVLTGTWAVPAIYVPSVLISLAAGLTMMLGITLCRICCATRRPIDPESHRDFIHKADSCDGFGQAPSAFAFNMDHGNGSPESTITRSL